MQPPDDSDRQLRQHQLLELLRHLADRIHAIDGVAGVLDAAAEIDQWRGDACHALADLDDYSTGHSLDDHHRIVAEARQSSFSFDQIGEE